MISDKKSALLPVLMTVILAVALVAGVTAQDSPTELAPPETLLDALDLPVCDEFRSDASLIADADTAVQITPDGAAGQTVLVFDLSALDRDDVLALIRFQSKETVAAKAATVPLQSYEAVADAETANGSDAGLYGWLTIFFDADGAALCRTTAYPAVGGDDEPLVHVSFQGFIAQMVSSARLNTARYQAGEFCSFDTPQYCDAIFIGDDTAENIVGTQGSDMIRGMGGNDTLSGRGGSDYIEGGDGDDVIYGGDGDDVIYGGSGGDVIRGDGGNDSIEGGTGLDTLDGGEGIDTVNQ